MYPASVADWRLLAQRHLPRFLFDYVAGGAGDETTLAANVADFAAIRLRQRVLVNVDQRDLSTTIVGQKASLPIALARLRQDYEVVRLAATQLQSVE